MAGGSADPIVLAKKMRELRNAFMHGGAPATVATLRRPPSREGGLLRAYGVESPADRTATPDHPLTWNLETPQPHELFTSRVARKNAWYEPHFVGNYVEHVEEHALRVLVRDEPPPLELVYGPQGKGKTTTCRKVLRDVVEGAALLLNTATDAEERLSAVARLALPLTATGRRRRSPRRTTTRKAGSC